MTLLGGAPGKRQIFEVWFKPRGVCYISWEEDSRSGLPGGFPLSAVVLQFGPCCTAWLLEEVSLFFLHCPTFLTLMQLTWAVGLQ